MSWLRSLTLNKAQATDRTHPTSEVGPYEYERTGPAADILDFRYSPFNDGLGQIRLVKILSCGRPGDHSQMLHARISTHDIAHLPPYTAISYTWGEIDEIEIRLNGSRFRIRKNCLYSLQQFDLHFKGQYLWVDSVCINQGDMAEKSLAVRNMLSVYQGATRVIACIGRAVDSAEYILNLAARQARSNLNIESTVRQAWNTQSKEMRRAVWEFIGDNPYWSRLWIVQEVVTSQGRLMFVCGEKLISASQIDTIRTWAHEIAPEKTQQMTSLFKPGGVAWKAPDIDSLLTELETNRRLCFDPRDRIFGALGMITWPANMKPLLPDYNMSRFQLACETATRMRGLAGVGYMVRGLQLDMNSPEIHMLQLVRRPAAEELSQGSMDDGRHTISAGHGSGKHDTQIVCTIIHAGANGQLIADVEHSAELHHSPREQRWVHDDTRLEHERRIRVTRLESSMSAVRHKCIYSSSKRFDAGELVGWVCPDATANDILVHFGAQEDEMLLVLRHRREQEYDLVGQGILVPGNVLHRGRYDLVRTRTRQSNARATVELKLTPEEIVCLMAHDMPSSLGEPDSEARAQRLAINPAREPRAAASIRICT